MPISAATSLGVNGPRPPRAPATRSATSASRRYQPPRNSRTAAATSGSDQPAATISWSTRTYPERRSSSRKSHACSHWRHSGSGPAYIVRWRSRRRAFSPSRTREDELLLAAEVVVDLAERDLGGIGDAAGREVGIPDREEGRPRGGEDGGAGVGRRAIASFGARLRYGHGLVHVVTRIRPHQVTDATE